MSLVASQASEEDGQSVINWNGQTPVMSSTGWPSDTTTETGPLTRGNGSIKKSAVL